MARLFVSFCVMLLSACAVLGGKGSINNDANIGGVAYAELLLPVPLGDIPAFVKLGAELGSNAVDINSEERYSYTAPYIGIYTILENVNVPLNIIYANFGLPMTHGERGVSLELGGMIVEGNGFSYGGGIKWLSLNDMGYSTMIFVNVGYMWYLLD